MRFERRPVEVTASFLVDRDSGQSEERLLMAALEAFAEYGYHGTTTRLIAKRVGLSPAAIYMHYSSKEALLFLIMRRTLEEGRRRMQVAAGLPGPPVERLRRVTAAVVAFNAEVHTAARVANHEIPALNGDYRASISTLRESIEELLADCIQQGIDAGELEVSDLRLAVFAILSMAIGVSRWYRDGGRLTPEEIGKAHGDFVVNMFRKTGQRGSKTSGR